MKSADYSFPRSFDGFGIALSGLCLIHCLLLPITLVLLPALSLSPALGWLHDNEWLHVALLFPIFLVSGTTLLRGARLDRRIGYIGGAGIAALCIALFAPNEWAEQIITTFGTVMLIVAHILNIRRRAA
ncbi:MAG: MerC domain-containing protein [Pseudomonadota bacterium]